MATDSRHVLDLGDVQETMLIPLYARATEAAKRNPILRDQAAVEMVRAIDYDFSRFGRGTRVMATYFALRTAIFDEWVGGFLTRYPAGTVVEIGAGLSTRYERLDNGMASWIDVDLPDAVQVRRLFLPELPRRQTIAASVLEASWLDVVAQSPPPYLFAAEGVLVYLADAEVRRALGMMTARFPGCRIAFDTYGTSLVRGSDQRGPLAATRARLAWACDDPCAIEEWGFGLRLVDSRTLAQPQRTIRRRLPWSVRAALPAITTLAPRRVNSARVNLFQQDVAQRSAGMSPVDL